MSRLQKSAWVNLIGTAVCVIVAGALFSFLSARNVKGVAHLFICIVVGSLTGLGVFLLSRKKGIEAGFDEREKMIYRRAFIWAAYVLTLFLASACIIPFFILGGQTRIPVYILPALFLGGLFVAQFVHSATILIQCSIEAEDE